MRLKQRIARFAGIDDSQGSISIRRERQLVRGVVAVASGPSPMAGVARLLPVLESVIAIFFPSQTEKRRCPVTSMASPEGESQPSSGHTAVCFFAAASRRTISFWSSIFTNTVPVPSTAGNSGLPGSGSVATTVRVSVSMIVTFLLRPLNAQRVLVEGSKAMPSGLVPAGIEANFASDGTIEDNDLVRSAVAHIAKCPFVSNATPCSPLKPVRLPTDLPVSASRTSSEWHG